MIKTLLILFVITIICLFIAHFQFKLLVNTLSKHHDEQTVNGLVKNIYKIFAIATIASIISPIIGNIAFVLCIIIFGKGLAPIANNFNKYSGSDKAKLFVVLLITYIFIIL